MVRDHRHRKTAAAERAKTAKRILVKREIKGNPKHESRLGLKMIDPLLNTRPLSKRWA